VTAFNLSTESPEQSQPVAERGKIKNVGQSHSGRFSGHDAKLLSMGVDNERNGASHR